MAEMCPICKSPRQAQIEAEYIRGEITAEEIMAEMEIDLVGILIHFEHHPMAVEKAAAEKESRLAEISTTTQSLILTQTDSSDSGPVDVTSMRVKILASMLESLQMKFEEIMATKQVSGISNIAKEIRETMREIEKVKREEKISMADKTSSLFEEHRSMTRFLLHNLCDSCMAKYEEWLKETRYSK